MDKPLVKVTQGLLQGISGKNINGEHIFKFHGIPFAKPPLGELRFKDPQPAESWDGIRDASKEASACYGINLTTEQKDGSEDCLYLNVYVKNLPVKNVVQLKPVMIWLHGGAYVRGSSSTKSYGPDFLLTEDIVLVTINYRYGVLGFLSLDDLSLGVSGNAGLKDQNMALQWVQQNIHSFGGDKSNVTLFGASAGSSSAHYHILSPKSKGLFHKAILQSGCALSVWGQGDRCCYKELVKALGHDVRNEKEALDILRNTPVEKLYDAQVEITEAISDTVFILWIIASVKNHVKSSSAPVYLYKLTIESGLNFYKNLKNINYPGVSHADENGYLFKSLVTPEIQKDSLEEISYKRFVKMWTNFAKHSDPTPNFEELQVKWLPVTDSNDVKTLIIGRQLEMASNPDEEVVSFWRDIFKENDFVKEYL